MEEINLEGQPADVALTGDPATALLDQTLDDAGGLGLDTDTTPPEGAPGDAPEGAGDDPLTYDQLDPETRATIDQLFADADTGEAGADDTVTDETDLTGSLTSIATVDGVLTTQKDLGGNLWAFIYPNITPEQARADPTILLDTPPVVFVSVNAPIAALGGSKPVFTINLNAGTAEQIRGSIEAGVGPGIATPTPQGTDVPVPGLAVFGNLRVGGLDLDSTDGDVGGFARLTGGAFLASDGPNFITAIGATGNANGMWHVLQAVENGLFDGVLPETVTNGIETSLEALPDNQEAFIAAFGTADAFLGGPQGVGFAYTATAGAERFRLNNGELVNGFEVNIPVGNNFTRIAIDPGEYGALSLEDPFAPTVPDFESGDFFPLVNSFNQPFSDPLGPTASESERLFASFLFDNYTARGLDPDEALTRVEVDLSGGLDSANERIVETLIDAAPETVTRQSFIEAGIVDVASYPAMALFEGLVLDGASPQEAWDEVSQIFADGFTGEGFTQPAEIGPNGGGFMGGFLALRAALTETGINPNSRFSQPDLSGADPLTTGVDASETAVGDLVAGEVTGIDFDLVEQLIAFPNNQPTNSLQDVRIGRHDIREEITLADGTEGLYLQTTTGQTFFWARETRQVFAISGTTFEQAQAMSLEVNEGGGTDRLISSADPGVAAETVLVPRQARPEVAVSGRTNPESDAWDNFDVSREDVILADGTVGELLILRNADGSVAQEYLRVEANGENFYFNRADTDPDPETSILINRSEDQVPLMVQISDLIAGDGQAALAEAFAGDSIRRQSLANGGSAIHGSTETGEAYVLYIAPGGQIRLLDVTEVPEDTVFDLLEREGSAALEENLLVPQDATQIEFEPLGTNLINLQLDNGETVLVAANFDQGLTGIFTSDDPAFDLPEPESALTGPALQFQNDVNALLYDAEGQPLNVYSQEQAFDIAYDGYRINTLSGDVGGVPTNAPRRDERYNTFTDADQEAIPRPVFNAIFNAEYANLAVDIIPAQTGDAGARARLEEAGFEFTEDGLVADNGGGAVAQAGRIAGDRAKDPDRVAPLIALGPDATPEELAAAAETGPPTEDVNADGTLDATIADLRADTAAQITLLEETGGADSQIGVLRIFDEILAAVELGEGNFSGQAVASFLQSSQGNVQFFLEQLGLVNEAAWSAILDDLGALVGTFTDGERSAIADTGYSLGLSGQFLTLLGQQEGNDALIASGGLLTVASNTVLATSGREVPGFGAEAAPGLVLGSGLGQLGQTFAARTDTPVDDVITTLATEGFRAWSFFDAPGLSGPQLSIGIGTPVIDGIPGGATGGPELTGGTTVNNDLVGASIIAGAAGSILGQVIDGDVGRILEGLGDATAASLAIAAGAISPAVGALQIVNSVLGAAGIELPPEASLAASVIVAAAYASNPGGWVALAVQVVLQFASIRSWTQVTEFATDIDADADFLTDDAAFISTDFSSNFFGRVTVEDGRILYEVNGVNPDLLDTATFDLVSERFLEVERFRSDGEGGNETRISLDGVDYNGTIMSGNRAVPLNGRIRQGRGSNEVTSATFVSNDGTLEIPVRISNHGDDDGINVSIAAGAEDALPPNYRIDISGTYTGLNPVTGPEDFNGTIGLSAEEFTALAGELGSEGPVTLAGTDPLLAGGPGTSSLATVIDRLTVTFDSNERDPNFYQYIDINQDGNLDLIRYGIRAGNDGLHSGDEVYEVTLLDANREPLGLRNTNGELVQPLPTIRASTIEEAVEIGSLSTYLYQWGAGHTETGRNGQDAGSLYHQAQEAGHLDQLVELRDLNEALRADLVRMQLALAESGEEVDEALFDELIGSIQTDDSTLARIVEIENEIGLFDTAAYQEANPGDLPAAFDGNPIELSYHYMTNGNAEGRVINAAGDILPVGTQPILGTDSPLGRVTYIGNSLVPGQRMDPGDVLLSDNGQFATVYQSDGDLITFDLSSGTPQQIWAADRDSYDGSFFNLDGRAGHATVQADGNFVLYNDRENAVFDSGTESNTGEAHGNYELRLFDDGNLNLFDQLDGRILWAGGPGPEDNGGNGVRFGRATPEPVNA